MSRRGADHAGSWYTSNASRLDQELSNWLESAKGDSSLQQPIRGLKAIIAPHAGYSYSGPTAAYAYSCIDSNDFDRIFILGPSHHKYIDGCALSTCAVYETPLGDLRLDATVMEQLQATKKFHKLSQRVDEAEHSVEMHLPYLRHVFRDKNVTIVPILVGGIDTATEAEYGALLAPYLADKRSLFVVSSDFAHWGTRFNYTHYRSSPEVEGTSLLRSARTPNGQAIHDSIEQVDKEGMALIELEDQQSNAGAQHRAYAEYVKRTRNTICGRHPIGVLLGAIAALQKSEQQMWLAPTLKFVRYAQSSHCVDVDDSSVSYASAYLSLSA